MNDIIIISDLHLKSKEPYWNAQLEFLKWLEENFDDDFIIFTGDITDTSTPTWEVHSEFEKFLINRNNKTYIVHGNHEFSRLKGSALLSYSFLDKVCVAFDPQVHEISNIKFLLLPYLYTDMNETYENYVWKEPDGICVTHLAPPGTSYGHGEVDLKNISCKTIIHGHIHIYDRFIKHDVDNIILGVPLITRNGEQYFKKQILKIDSKTKNLEFIEVPEFLTIETVEYGKYPNSKKNIINVVNAPNVNSVLEKYKDYHIREEGISIVRTKASIDNDTPLTLGIVSSLKEKFIAYSKDVGVSKEVFDLAISYIDQQEIQ